MSKEEFENYLALVSRLLRLSPSQREQIGEELRDHLESRTTELVDSGIERSSAVKQAIEEFGDAAAFAENLKKVSVQNRNRWMMRFATVCTAVAFLVIVFSMAMWPDNARFGTPGLTTAQNEKPKPGYVEKNLAHAYLPSAETQANEMIRQRLKRICQLQYEELPFSNVEDDLEDQLDLNIILTHSAKDDSLSEDEPVTINLHGLPYSNALKIMLAEKNATYCVQDGVLKIISLDEMLDENFFARKMINVNSLLTLTKRKEASRIGTPIAARPRGGLGDDSHDAGGVFCRQDYLSKREVVDGSDSEITRLTDAILSLKDNTTNRATVQTITAESILIEAAQSAVQQDIWQYSGGNCRMNCVGGIMIINAPEAINEEVESFLVDLEYAMQSDSNWVPQPPISPRSTRKSSPVQSNNNSESEINPVTENANEANSDPFAE